MSLSSRGRWTTFAVPRPAAARASSSLSVPGGSPSQPSRRQLSASRSSGSSLLLGGYDEPEPLRCSATSNRPMGADGGNSPTTTPRRSGRCSRPARPGSTRSGSASTSTRRAASSTRRAAPPRASSRSGRCRGAPSGRSRRFPTSACRWRGSPRVSFGPDGPPLRRRNFSLASPRRKDPLPRPRTLEWSVPSFSR